MPLLPLLCDCFRPARQSGSGWEPIEVLHVDVQRAASKYLVPAPCSPVVGPEANCSSPLCSTDSCEPAQLQQRRQVTFQKQAASDVDPADVTEPEHDSTAELPSFSGQHATAPQPLYSPSRPTHDGCAAVGAAGTGQQQRWVPVPSHQAATAPQTHPADAIPQALRRSGPGTPKPHISLPASLAPPAPSSPRTSTRVHPEPQSCALPTKALPPGAGLPPGLGPGDWSAPLPKATPRTPPSSSGKAPSTPKGQHARVASCPTRTLAENVIAAAASTDSSEQSDEFRAWDEQQQDKSQQDKAQGPGFATPEPTSTRLSAEACRGCGDDPPRTSGPPLHGLAALSRLAYLVTNGRTLTEAKADSVARRDAALRRSHNGRRSVGGASLRAGAPSPKRSLAGTAAVLAAGTAGTAGTAQPRNRQSRVPRRLNTSPNLTAHATPASPPTPAHAVSSSGHGSPHFVGSPGQAPGASYTSSWPSPSNSATSNTVPPSRSPGAMARQEFVPPVLGTHTGGGTSPRPSPRTARLSGHGSPTLHRLHRPSAWTDLSPKPVPARSQSGVLSSNLQASPWAGPGAGGHPSSPWAGPGAGGHPASPVRGMPFRAASHASIDALNKVVEVVARLKAGPYNYAQGSPAGSGRMSPQLGWAGAAVAVRPRASESDRQTERQTHDSSLQTD